MFSFFKQLFDQYKTYRETDFSFEYAEDMEVKTEGDVISVFKKNNAIGMFQMTKVSLKESGQTFEELLNHNIKSVEEENISYDTILLNGLKGIMFQRKEANQEVDHWQLGNAKLYFYFSYQYVAEHSDEKLEEEKEEFFRLIRQLRVN